jgi:GNAT superfamily N-acetyltransferase
MVDRVIHVRAVRPAEWEMIRDVRLAALKEAPYAFASTHEKEAGYSESRWRAAAASLTWFAAWRDGRPVGIVAGVHRDGDPPDEQHVVSMWVEPAARGTGVADALISAVADWAIGQGARRLTLWAADGNPRATGFYLRRGFLPTGGRQPLPSNPATLEDELALDLNRIRAGRGGLSHGE